jgi:hypothetical protein
MDRREQIARIIDPRGFENHALYLQKEQEWRDKARDFPSSSQGNPASYPHGQASVDCIQTTQIFRVQWTNCPIEVYEEVQKLWRWAELHNDNNYSWDRDEEFWDENCEDEAELTMKEAFPLIDEYLQSRGISKIEINYWW